MIKNECTQLATNPNECSFTQPLNSKIDYCFFASSYLNVEDLPDSKSDNYSSYTVFLLFKKVNSNFLK